MPDTIPHLPIGSIIGNGKYKIIRFIAAGGFGCTYEAEFMMMRQRVAIKEFFISSMCNRQASGAISLGAVSQSHLIQRLEEKFVREAQNLFGLSHPHIVGVKDVFKEFGTSYYVMDYIDGRSLQSIIEQNGPLPEAQVMKYMAQVMDALEYVHGKKMLHLDLKPDNIMIDSNDRAILIDFGVSKQYDEVDGHNTSTILGQTPGFAPLEQMGNNIANFAPATDIYALGATMYAALTGQTPPTAANLLSGVSMLQPLPQQTSPQTRRAIELMMRARSVDRPQTIHDVRTLLQQRPQQFQPQPFGPAQQPQQQPYTPQPTYQSQPYQQPMHGMPLSSAPEPPSNTGAKVAKFIFMGLAILCTVLSFIFFISFCEADYVDDEDFYAGCWVLFCFVFAPLFWILFGVFAGKSRRR